MLLLNKLLEKDPILQMTTKVSYTIIYVHHEAISTPPKLEKFTPLTEKDFLLLLEAKTLYFKFIKSKLLVTNAQTWLKMIKKQY